MAGFILEADIDKIPGLEHLLGSLDKTRLVPVKGWQMRNPGKIYGQTKQ